MENIIIFICILLVPCIAYSVISYTYSKYKETTLKSKMSGFEIARNILDDNDLKDLYIVEIKVSLNDHYDFNQKVVRLSTDVYHGENITAACVAARVCSYAIQDKNNNSFMKFGATLNPLINFDTYASYLLFIIGLCLQDFGIVKVAVLLLLIALVFRIVTLPVEFDAIKEASKSLNKMKKFEESEIQEMTNVLKVSPYTFIMSILTCISNLINEIVYNLQKKG